MGLFFCGKLTKSCRHARTFQVVSLQSLSSINNKKLKNFSKTTTYSPHYPLRHPAPLFWHWYAGVNLRIFDPRPSNPTSFPGLCSPGDYRQTIESPVGVQTLNSTEKALTITIYDCIRRIRPRKVCYLTKANFHKKMEMMNLQYFCIFMYI